MTMPGCSVMRLPGPASRRGSIAARAGRIRRAAPSSRCLAARPNGCRPHGSPSTCRSARCQMRWRAPPRQSRCRLTISSRALRASSRHPANRTASSRSESTGAPPLDQESVPVVDGTLRAPWKWEQLIVESAVIGGDPQRWHRRLRGLAEQYRQQWVEEAREDPDSPRLLRIERDARNLAHLRAFALPVIDALASWLAPAEQTRTPGDPIHGMPAG